MRRIALVVLVVLVVGACSSAHTRDVDTPTVWGKTSVELSADQYSEQAPDQLDIVFGLDGHPNLARVCFDGLAFVTSTSEFRAWDRVPEWDDYCEGERP